MPASSGADQKNRWNDGRFRVRADRGEHGRFAAKQGFLQPSRGTRTCHAEPGPIRSPRGAERGLEANGRRFRTAARPRETGTGLDFDIGTEGQTVMTTCQFFGQTSRYHRASTSTAMVASRDRSLRPHCDLPVSCRTAAPLRLARSWPSPAIPIEGAWQSPDPAAPASRWRAVPGWRSRRSGLAS